MIDDLVIVAGIILKYCVIFFFIAFSIAILSSLFSKLRDEPITLIKLTISTLIPFATATGISYFLLHKQLQWPSLLNIIIGFFIYAKLQNLMEKIIDTRFKDEK